MRRAEAPHLVVLPGGAAGTTRGRSARRNEGRRMSGRLVGETVGWLTTPAAQDVTLAERTVLLIVAERAHERTRIMLRHRTDREPLIDRIAKAAKLDKKNGLKRTFRLLAARGLEVRVEIGEDRNGLPIFAREGISMGFRLPEFPPGFDCELPVSGGAEVTPSDPVDNPEPDEHEGVTSAPPLSPEGVTSAPPLAPRGGHFRTPLSTSKSIPSKTFYPSTSLPISGAEVEGDPDAPEHDDKPIDQEALRAAQNTLLATPDGAALIAQAAAAAPNAGHDRHLITAAHLATRRPA